LPRIDVFQNLSRKSKMGAMIFLSTSLHMMIIFALLLLPNLSSSRTFYSPVYSVRLVNVQPSLAPENKEAPKPVAVTPPPPPPPAAAPPKIKEKAKPISLSPAKTKEEDSEQKITQAIERLRQQRESKNLDAVIERLRHRQESKSVDTAIERLRAEKEARQVSAAIENIRNRVTIGSSGAIETGEPGMGGATSGVMSIKFKIYYNLLWQRIRSVWVLPEDALGGQKNLETIIAIRIAKDGQIVDIQFEKKSGNSHLDESALRAIKKANPLPPLPPGIVDGDKFDVGVRFTPSDL